MYLIFFFFLPLSFLSFINKSKIYVVGSCPSTGLYISVLSRFLWQYPFASLAPHLSTLSVSTEIAVGSFVSQKLAGIGSRSPLSKPRFVARYFPAIRGYLKEVINGEAIFARKNPSSLDSHLSFESIDSTKFPDSRSHFFNFEKFQSQFEYLNG